MRRPAAYAGVYSNRPSQGLMNLDNAMPISFSEDTSGVFRRDPYKWIKFARNYYIDSLHEIETITDLPSFEVPDTKAFPKPILYPVDLLLLNNSAA
jgi:hypothetical protein